MAAFRSMTCPDCGTRMHLRRTRRRRTMEGYDRTTIWWDCDCGGQVREGEIDPVYRGVPLPQRRSAGATRRVMTATRPRPSAGREVVITGDDGTQLVKVVVRLDGEMRAD